MPKPGTTQITVSDELRKEYEYLAADRQQQVYEDTGMKVNVTVQTILALLLEKIKKGEIKL